MRFSLRLLRNMMVCALALVAGSAWAQSGSGDLAGRVTDAGGAVIAGAKVTVRSLTAVGVETQTQTTEAGDYAVTSLRPGVYTVRVEAEGFATVERTGVTIKTGVRSRVDVELRAGAADQVVNVSADA